MNRGRKVTKHNLARNHRQQQYLKAINGVIDGKISPEYATLRWQKVKEVK